MSNRSEKAYLAILDRIEQLVGKKIKLKALVTDQEQVRAYILFFLLTLKYKINNSLIPIKHNITPSIKDLMWKKFSDVHSIYP